jgi:hypothetical protein
MKQFVYFFLCACFISFSISAADDLMPIYDFSQERLVLWDFKEDADYSGYEDTQTHHDKYDLDKAFENIDNAEFVEIIYLFTENAINACGLSLNLEMSNHLYRWIANIVNHFISMNETIEYDTYSCKRTVFIVSLIYFEKILSDCIVTPPNIHKCFLAAVLIAYKLEMDNIYENNEWAWDNVFNHHAGPLRATMREINNLETFIFSKIFFADQNFKINVYRITILETIVRHTNMALHNHQTTVPIIQIAATIQSNIDAHLKQLEALHRPTGPAAAEQGLAVEPVTKEEKEENPATETCESLGQNKSVTKQATVPTEAGQEVTPPSPPGYIEQLMQNIRI